MIFAKNVMLSNVLDIKEAFLDYENVHVIIIVHPKKDNHFLKFIMLPLTNVVICLRF